MTFQVVRVGLQRLKHNPVELLLALLVPIVFFTIFAMIFDKQLGSGKTKPIRVTTVDTDGTAVSQELLDAVAGDELVLHEPVLASPATNADRGARHGADDPAESFDLAGERVLRGEVTIAVVVPEGWTASLGAGEPLPLRVLADTSDPVAPKMIEAVVARALGEATAGATPDPGGPTPGAGPGSGRATPPPPAVEVVDLLSEEKVNPVVSMYAAGIAVMFLLFSATGNAGQLLDEEENQTLERLMCSRLGMTQLIVGKWLLLMILGVVQITLMFGWAQLVFGVDLTGHVPAFTMMTLATVGAAAGLALALAAACRSRGQLNAVSVILILTMSALGGSMVPRYLMSDAMQQAGRFTFNAWAIDGYNKIFWRDLPLADLAPELMVLGGSALGLLLLARLLATRWEMA
ncbi:MAG: ABC transporter permease [Planctomycetota bacterium]